jgi:hypothetical protein
MMPTTRIATPATMRPDNGPPPVDASGDTDSYVAVSLDGAGALESVVRMTAAGCVVCTGVVSG